MFGEEERRLWGDLAALAKSWWRVDRVRASPREGAALRVEPPFRLRIAGRAPVDVCTRRVEEDEEGSRVVLEIVSPQGPSEIVAWLPSGTFQPRYVWIQATRATRVREEDLEVVR